MSLHPGSATGCTSSGVRGMTAELCDLSRRPLGGRVEEGTSVVVALLTMPSPSSP